jgi:hypothetical protein
MLQLHKAQGCCKVAGPTHAALGAHVLQIAKGSQPLPCSCDSFWLQRIVCAAPCGYRALLLAWQVRSD